MHIYKVIVSNNASSDLDGMVQFIANLHRPDTGHKYVNRILGQLAALSYTADAFTYSRFSAALAIHPMAKTLSIMNHQWTVVFHIQEEFVIIDRIIPSKLMK